MCIALCAEKRLPAGAGAAERAARVLIAGTGSGCGKTVVTLALLQAFVNRGIPTASFKCGPDYIDPLFHSEIVGVPGTNLDLFFSGEEGVRRTFLRFASELNVIEGVMGYYDGLAADSPEASSWQTACALDAPALLVVNGRGMALSIAAAVKGYCALRQPSRIAGVILNGVSTGVYPTLKAAVERECGVPVFGFLPRMPEAALESRHLGLVTAAEVTDLRSRLQALAAQAEKSLDLEGILALMRAQAPLAAKPVPVRKAGPARIAVARDRAFCFYYRENLEMLREMGAELVPFSPLADSALPPCDGLYLGGGYPELYAEQLEANASMREQMALAVASGLPTVAECGGFMYLTEAIAGRRMAGVLPGSCRDMGKLTRFGYVLLRAPQDSLLFEVGNEIRGHEFHHWDADDPGDALEAVKPSGRRWRCAHVSDTLYAGFPHLAFASNPGAAERFVRKCAEWRRTKEAAGHDAHGDRAAEL